MTIHRALAELKLIDSRIAKGVTDIEPIGVMQKGKKVNNFIPSEDFKNLANHHYNSVTDLIKRKQDIKSAIVRSNGSTSVKIGDKVMTVSDAITFKKIIDHKKIFLSKLQSECNKAAGNLNKANEQVQKNLEALLQAALGKDSTKVTKDDIDAISKPYLENNEFTMFDPLGIKDKISALEKECAEFEAEVDAVLSESNAITIIEI